MAEELIETFSALLNNAETIWSPSLLLQVSDCILIFDEVMTGFRVSYGGAQKAFKIKPDMTCLGKVIGGGLPVGAYGGRADIMDHMLPVGKVFQAGTLSAISSTTRCSRPR